MLTRRDCAKITAGALTFASAGNAQAGKVAPFASKFNSVQIGAQTYSYRALKDPSAPWSLESMDRLMDRVVDAYVQNQINLAEFWVAFVEPPGNPGRTLVDPKLREGLRQWRLAPPLAFFEKTRRKFNDAGITIYSAMTNLSDDLVEGEIDTAFAIAQALGANILSANCTVRSIKRAAPFADKHKLYLSAHSENATFDSNVDGMVFGDNLARALTYSPNMRITLDTGHFAAYNGDVMKFLREHKDRIVNLHLKDRLHNHPQPHTDEDTTEWGKGDAPLKEALQWMKKEKVNFAACIEYEYPGKGTPVEEVGKCLAYAKAALA